jgi:hypothetical protein
LRLLPYQTPEWKQHQKCKKQELTDFEFHGLLLLYPLIPKDNGCCQQKQAGQDHKNDENPYQDA